jgi:hypothetical protein
MWLPASGGNSPEAPVPRAPRTHSPRPGSAGGPASSGPARSSPRPDSASGVPKRGTKSAGLGGGGGGVGAGSGSGSGAAPAGVKASMLTPVRSPRQQSPVETALGLNFGPALGYVREEPVAVGAASQLPPNAVRPRPHPVTEDPSGLGLGAEEGGREAPGGRPVRRPVTATGPGVRRDGRPQTGDGSRTARAHMGQPATTAAGLALGVVGIGQTRHPRGGSTYGPSGSLSARGSSGGAGEGEAGGEDTALWESEGVAPEARHLLWAPASEMDLLVHAGGVVGSGPGSGSGSGAPIPRRSSAGASTGAVGSQGSGGSGLAAGGGVIGLGLAGLGLGLGVGSGVGPGGAGGAGGVTPSSRAASSLLPKVPSERVPPTERGFPRTSPLMSPPAGSAGLGGMASAPASSGSHAPGGIAGPSNLHLSSAGVGSVAPASTTSSSLSRSPPAHGVVTVRSLMARAPSGSSHRTSPMEPSSPRSVPPVRDPQLVHVPLDGSVSIGEVGLASFDHGLAVSGDGGSGSGGGAGGSLDSTTGTVLLESVRAGVTLVLTARQCVCLALRGACLCYLPIPVLLHACGTLPCAVPSNHRQRPAQRVPCDASTANAALRPPSHASAGSLPMCTHVIKHISFPLPLLTAALGSGHTQIVCAPL